MIRILPFLLLCVPLLAPARPKTPYVLTRSRSVEEILVLDSVEYGLNPSMVLAIAWRESRFDAKSVNPETGAAGVMGLMPSSAKILGVSDSLDPEQNIRACTRFLASLLASYGRDKALCLYGRRWSECK